MEKNKEILQKTIRSLPSFEAPPQVWDAIQLELDSDQKLQHAIQSLPTYEAPALVWEQIEKNLEPKIISMPLVDGSRKNDKYKWLAVAATVAILLSAGLWFLTTLETQENIQIVTTEETIYEQLLIEDWEEDESIIQEVAQLFAQSKVAQSSLHYSDLLEEYQELETAKETIEDMMKQYGKATDFIRQISKIELERSTLVKQMATLI
ncbi:MAG: hypothetical protein MK226_09105 [Saprospiraceae bacterium]|jgi:hypothetical protein|nr:hypothetical protein [Saprospiraceae bacterium]